MIRCAGIVPIWESHWNKKYERNRKVIALRDRKPISILPTLFRTFGAMWLGAAALELCTALLQFANPQLVDLIISEQRIHSSDQGSILGYDDCSKSQDAGLVEQVVKMVERVSVRRERGGAGCPPILVE